MLSRELGASGSDVGARRWTDRTQRLPDRVVPGGAERQLPHGDVLSLGLGDPELGFEAAGLDHTSQRRAGDGPLTLLQRKLGEHAVHAGLYDHGSDPLLVEPRDRTQAVYLPLPVSRHAQWSLRAAEAGKAVLVEKPMARNAAEARSMAEAFTRRGLLLAEAMMYCYHPLNRKALDMVRAGDVGEVRMARASFNAATSDPNDIRLRKETGGGAMLDVGCYCLSILRSIAGQEPFAIKALARMGEVDENLAGVL